MEKKWILRIREKEKYMNKKMKLIKNKEKILRLSVITLKQLK